MKIQTRVPEAVGRWLQHRAEEQGMLVAQVARDVLTDAYRRAWIRGWIFPVDRSDPAVVLSNEPNCRFFFEVLRDGSGGDLVVALLHGEMNPDHMGQPVTKAFLDSTMGIFNDLLERHAVLYGSPRPWFITRCWFNANAGRMELTLSLHPPTRKSDPELVVLAGQEEGFFCFVRDPLGRKCRITSVKPSEIEARQAAAQWIEEAHAEQGQASSPAYRWARDPAGYPEMHVCYHDRRSAPILR